jgi:hypothetical protein
LESSYRATSYFVDGPNGRFTLRIGLHSCEADVLAAESGVNEWAYITAYNPGSVLAPWGRNEARQRELEKIIKEGNYIYYRGEGVGDDGAWPAEPSFFVLGIDENTATALARRFGQAAVVFGERFNPARLLWTGRDSPGG